MKISAKKTKLDNEKIEKLKLNTWALHCVKGGCDDDSDCEEQHAVVLDNGSGG